QRARAEAERLATAAAAAEAQGALHREAIEHARQEEAALRRRLTREGEAVLARVRELWQTVQREARREERRRVSGEALREQPTDAERALEALAGPPAEVNGTGSGLDPSALTPGMRVRIVDLGVEAELVSGPDRDGRVQLKRGSWNIQSHVGRLAPAGAEPQPATRPVAATWSAGEGVPIEVDLRGMDASDAIVELDRGVDRAVVAGFSEVRVIHGVGRGVLRAAVQNHLRQHAQVSGQRPGEMGEGGRGVTVARLR